MPRLCQGPECHTYDTTDRKRGPKGNKRNQTRTIGTYAYANIDSDNGYRYWNSDKYFCSQGCKLSWLSVNMENIEQGRPIEFIRHRRESGGYSKVTEEHDSWNGGTYTSTSIKRVDNRTELE